MGQLKLPLFEGNRPEVSEIRLSGTVPCNNEEPFHIDEEAYFLIRVQFTGINHERKGRNETLVRSHKAKVRGIREIDAGEQISDVLVQEAYQYLEALDAQQPDDGEDD